MCLDLVVQIHNVQNIHQLTFVLMQSLNLNIEDGVRIDFNSVMLLDVFCQTYFVLIFDIHELLQSFLVIRVNFQFCQFRQIGDPAVTDMIGDPVSQQRVRMHQETSLCNTVCLVIEFLRIHLVEIFQLLFFQDLGMQSCNTVYRITASDCQVGHLNLSVVDDSHLPDFFLISRIFVLDLQDKSAVDLFDDLVYTRKQFGEQLDRPFFQSFCHDGMVGVCTGMRCDIPCFFPGHSFFVQQDTHQFGNRHGRMGIIQLEGYFLRQIMQIVVVLFEFCDCFLDTCRNEEILLFQTKLFTCIMVIIRVQNLYDILSQVFLFNGFMIFSLVKQIQTEISDRFCIPDSQSVDDLVIVTNDRHIVRNSHYRLITFLDELISSGSCIIFHAYISAEFYFFCIFRTTQFEWITIFQPVIRYFYLIAVFDFLFEQTIVITDTTAICTVSQSCQGIQETCCQSSQTTVTQCRIRLLIFDHVQIKSQLVQCFLYFFICS